MAKPRKKPVEGIEKIEPEVVELEPKPTNIVITFNGKSVPRNECRSIGGKYYKIGHLYTKDSGDCYQIKDTYYRITSNKIAWDYQNKKYNLIEDMILGYVPDKINSKGYFTPSEDNVKSAEGDVIMNEETIEIIGMRYDFSRGLYSFNPAATQPIVLRSKPTYTTLPTNIYGLADYPLEIIKAIDKQCSQTKFNPSKFDKFFFDYTYGLEIETDGGWFPEKLYYKYGAVPLKDGSIAGTEITTLPNKLKVDYINQFFTDLSKFTITSQNNSLHVNISGFENTTKFRVALYVLYYRLQQEINQFIPLYKRELNYLINKIGGAKDHCKPMESLGIIKKYLVEDEDALKESDKTIFRWLNEGVYDTTHNMTTRVHIKQNSPKWEWYSRYYALNLMPLYFGKPSLSRIEYRVHSGTVNKYKTLAWCLITAAITKFVELYADRILYTKDKIDLDEIFNAVYDPTNDSDGAIVLEFIKSYIQIRSVENINKLIKHDTNIYGNEFKLDNTFAINSFIFGNEPKKRS